MSVDSSAKVIIGFEVFHSDFWEQKKWKDDFLSCPSGHKFSDTQTSGEERGKFCSSCGGEWAYQDHQEMVPTHNFKKFCDQKNLAPEDVWAQEETHHEEQASSDISLDLLPADTYNDSESKTSTMVLGMELSVARQIESGGYGYSSQNKGIDEKTIVESFDKVREVANALGIDRPPVLYLTTYCG